MTNDKKQTAVDYLISKLNKEGFAPVVTQEEIDQAKAMEEQQAFEFWQGGIKCTDEGGKSFDKYFNETYKQP
jgi:hypothetical protein